MWLRWSWLSRDEGSLRVVGVPVALVFGGGIAASAAYADAPAMSMGNLYQSAGTTVNTQITDAVTSSAPTSSGHDRNEVRNPTLRDLDRPLRSDPVIKQ